MRLPGRLRSTSVGDLLGTLHRGRASGTLELVEESGRRHAIHVASGLVVAVEIDGSAATLADFLRRERAVDEAVLRRSLLRALASRRLLGDVLVHDFHIAPTVVGAALRRQVAMRLHLLERVADAQILFRVAVRAPRGALTDQPLGPNEFLAGRRRARDRGVSSERPPTSSCTRIKIDPDRRVALAALGISPDADDAEIKRAYRRLARDTHPDLHPAASEAEKRELALRFSEVTRAYKQLVA